ncbi:MAG: hypothetical protein HZA23_03400 [Nitrospirae bacterium]|nr:hypothetical protein [Nitrospirota bacterium]
MLTLYRLLQYLFLPWGILYLGARVLFRGRYRRGLGERLGQVPMPVLAACRGVRPLWIHAVSVGEVMAVLPLIEALRRRFPDLPLVLSTVTETGRQVAAERVGDRIGLFYLPFDLVPFVKKTLRDLHPRMVILVESEIWPNLLSLLQRDCIPVCLVNGRLSERSFRRYRLLPRFFRQLLSPLAAVGAQTMADQDRFLSLGAQKERIRVTGNLKFDQPEPGKG